MPGAPTESSSAPSGSQSSTTTPKESPAPSGHPSPQSPPEQPKQTTDLPAAHKMAQRRCPMLTVNEIQGTNIIEVTIDGSLSREELDQMVIQTEEMIEAHGKIKLIEIIKHFGKIAPSTIWADMKWNPRHLKYFSHIAIVADQRWIDWAVTASNIFISAEMKAFNLDELDEAREWIESAD